MGKSKTTTPERKLKIRNEFNKVDNKKYTKRFSDCWLGNESKYKDWIQKTDDPTKAKCKACNKFLTCGTSELEKHSSRRIHRENLKNMSLPKIESFYAYGIANNNKCQIEKIMEAEIKLSALFADNNIPFAFADDLIKVIKKVILDSKIVKDISLGQTKCTNIVKNVIARHETEELSAILRQVKFSILIDESTDIALTNLLCILVKYVHPDDKKVHVRLLELLAVHAVDFSAEKLYQAFKDCLKKQNIPITNVIGFASDGANVMVEQKNSFFTRLRADTSVLILIKCVCHTAAIVTSKACSALPRSPEDLLRNISGYLSSSAKRTAILTGIQEIFYGESKKILKLADTRWLSRLNCVERILDNWIALQSYFRLAEFEDKLKSAECILNSLQNVATKAYLTFLKYALNFFNTFNAMFQAQTVLVHILASRSQILYLQISANFIRPKYLDINVDIYNQNNLLPLEEIKFGTSCESVLRQLDVKAQKEIREVILNFYLAAAYEIRERLPIFESFFQSLNFITPEVCLNSSSERPTSIVAVAEKLKLKIDATKLDLQWISLAVEFSEDQKAKLVELSIEELWMYLSKVKDLEGNSSFSHCVELAHTVMALPHSNADAERIFSVVTDCKTKKRNRLADATLNAIVVTRSSFRSKNIRSSSFETQNRHIELMKSTNLY